MAFSLVKAERHYTAPIMTQQLALSELKEEAYEMVLELAKVEGFLLREKPRVRVLHGLEPFLEISVKTFERSRV